MKKTGKYQDLTITELRLQIQYLSVDFKEGNLSMDEQATYLSMKAEYNRRMYLVMDMEPEQGKLF